MIFIRSISLKLNNVEKKKIWAYRESQTSKKRERKNQRRKSSETLKIQRWDYMWQLIKN
jgi:hypothetical protein